MPVYHVSYDLHPPNPDYASMEATIKAVGGWAHILGSSWLVSTAETVEALSQRLRGVMHPQDRLFVSMVSPGQRNGWLTENFWAWIRQHENT